MIEIKGPNVFKGYWRMPEKTAAEFTADGFFISGDLGKIDQDGYVHIVGRGKDLVISGGYNIYPKEVEGEIDQIDGVIESAVIGVPHPDFGEGVTAIVVRKPGASVDEKAIVGGTPGSSRPLQAAQAHHLCRRPAAQHDGQGAEERPAAAIRRSLRQDVMRTVPSGRRLRDIRINLESNNYGAGGAGGRGIMGIELLSIGLLVAMFIIATIQPINMGALAFAGAFVLGSLIIGMKTSDIFAGFPSDLFLTLVAVTYLFAIAQINGTIDWLVEGAVRLVRGRIGLIPWVMFLVAAMITGFGALGPAAVAILAPVALSFAVQYRIHPVMMGLMVIHGAQAGGFSPISIYGGITNQIVEKAGLPFAPTSLFLSSFFFNLAIAVLVFFVFGGAKVMKHGTASFGPLPELHPRGRIGVDQRPWRHAGKADQGACLWYGGRYRFDVAPEQRANHHPDRPDGARHRRPGVQVQRRPRRHDRGRRRWRCCRRTTQKAAIDKVSWSTVLLIAGIITYVGVMEKAGTVDYVANAISSLGMPLLVALLLCFTGAIVSAFASSTALLGAIIPLAVPFLLQGHVSAVGVVAAIAISTTIVDTSPFSTNGALVVANAPDDRREQVLRQLLIYSALIAIIGPIVAWLVFVVSGLV